MLLSKEKSCQTRSSSGNKSLTRKQSVIKILSNSQIPKDFFRQPSQLKKSHPSATILNSLEFTFMPYKEQACG